MDFCTSLWYKKDTDWLGQKFSVCLPIKTERKKICRRRNVFSASLSSTAGGLSVGRYRFQNTRQPLLIFAKDVRICLQQKHLYDHNQIMLLKMCLHIVFHETRLYVLTVKELNYIGSWSGIEGRYCDLSDIQRHARHLALRMFEKRESTAGQWWRYLAPEWYNRFYRK